MYITQTTPCDSPGTIIFWCQKSLVGDPRFPLKFALKVTHPLRTPRFRPISAHSASTLRASKKVQLALIGSLPRAFQRDINEPCTLPLSPPKGDTKRDFAVFASKIQLLSKEVWSFFVWKLPAGAPKTRMFTFGVAFHIFVAGTHRHFKFGMWIEHSKSEPTDDKLSLKGHCHCGQCHATSLTFGK